MAEYRLPYGKSQIVLTLPNDRQVRVIAPAQARRTLDPAWLTEQALDNLLGGVKMEDFAGARTAAVAISDKTRPIPIEAIYPLLNWLQWLGLAPDQIMLLIATGTHSAMSPDEFHKVLPHDILERYPVYSHGCDDQTNLVHQGVTRRGTPVWTNRRFAEADLRVVVGNIEPHQFMGFSGGVKSGAIGLAGRETINHNHALMIDPLSQLGRYDDNPARQDIEEIGQIMGIQLALNTVLNRDKQIVRVIAGDPAAVMRAGIPQVRHLYEVYIAEPFDLVFTSPGGYPKDINLYQAQKALAHASLITRDGGTVVVVAACSEGTGSASYERWMEGMTTFEAVLDRFTHEEFRLGPHKAFQIARDAARVRTILVSDMARDAVKRLLLTPASLDEAVSMALRDLVSDARIAILPVANATVPVLSV